jgi:nucleoside-diphosphate-sugar epimerase
VTHPAVEFPSVFITGGSGFVGQQLLAHLARDGSASDVRVLSRAGAGGAPGAAVGTAPSWWPAQAPASWRAVRGALDTPASWRDALTGVHTVVHLASSTGKVSRAEHWHTIVDGTRGLLAEAKAAGVTRVVMVSSVAAGFADTRHYHYAQAKAQAEREVMASALATVIIRPTMVFGAGSPVQHGLRTMAARGLVFGSGTVRVQPVHVQDLVAQLVNMLHADIVYDGGAHTIGGPDVVTLEALLRTMRGTSQALRHIPVEPLRTMLATLEPFARALLPFTAGQLASFVNDSVAGAPSPWLTRRYAEHGAPRIALSAMLAEAA